MTGTDRLPARKRPGDTLSAGEFNAVVEVLRAVGGLRVGDGLTMVRTESGLVIGRGAAAGEAEELVGVITGSTVSGAGPGPFLPSDVRYTVEVIGRPDIVPLVNVLPVYGRPVMGDEFGVYPAAVGSACRVIVRPNPDGQGGMVAELEVMNEKVAGCAPENDPGAGPGGGA